MPAMFDPATVPMFETESTARDANVVVFGAPHGTPYRDVDNEQYASAPDALRCAVKPDTSWLDHWDFDFDGPVLGERTFSVADVGNLRTTALDGVGNRQLIQEATLQIVRDGAIPVMIGGDDSTPIPFFQALEGLGPLTVIQIDAHIDWRDERYGEPMGFSSTMRRASEMAHVESIVQVGIRGVGSARREEVEIARDWGAKIVTARDVHQAGLDAVLKHVKNDANCVITLDCDGMDPGVMPAVMAPSPGGLSYLQTVDLIHAVIRKANLVAFDLIEFVPERDRDGTAAITAGRILTNVIGRLSHA